MSSVSAARAGVIAGGNWIVDHGGRTYMDCTKQAHNDQAKIQQCADQFRSSLENTPTPAR